jgi:hypothetical protein
MNNWVKKCFAQGEEKREKYMKMLAGLADVAKELGCS